MKYVILILASGLAVVYAMGVGYDAGIEAVLEEDQELRRLAWLTPADFADRMCEEGRHLWSLTA